MAVGYPRNLGHVSVPNSENQSKVDWLNDVLCHFQQYFSHITVTAHIVHVFPGFNQYKAGALKCLAQGHFHEKSRESSGARTQNPKNTSQTLYHWATQDPFRVK